MEQPVAVAVAAERKPSMLSLLKQANFRTLWLAQTISWSGDHFSFLALMIVINQATGSASAIALLMVVMTVPRLLFGMAAGVFVDRWDRQRIMIISDAIRGLLSLSLIWIAASDHIWLVYPLGFIVSSVGVFFVPARGAVMKTILREDDLLPANILMQTTFTLTLVTGPALAGVMIGAWGTTPAFAFDAATFFISASLVAAMTIPRIVANSTPASGGASFWGEFKEGLAFVRCNRSILGLLLVLTVVSLATGAVNALFVPFLMNILNVGATELGLADSMQGIGMIMGGAVAAALAARLRANWIIAGGLFFASLIIVAIGLAPAYHIVLILLLLVGLIVMPVEATIPAVIQKTVPLDKMGRVGGTMNTSQSVATLVSMGVAGVLADVIGPRLIYVGAGVIGMIAALVAISAIRDE